MLKRKRSSSELGSPANPTHLDPAMDASQRTSYDTPAPHLPSRTLKRFRDGRPSDDEVHRKFYEWRVHHRPSRISCLSAEHTLDILYSAQRRPEQQQDTFPAPQPSLTPDPSATVRHQHTLHRFWNIDSAPTSAESSPGSDRPLVMEAPSSCQDCETDLREQGGGGDSMDLDGFPFNGVNTACGACGKHVCFSCSVSNLGEDKRCLQCAGRRVWIGGIGWTNNDVSVC